jgi:hypothetical protein
MSSTRPNGKTRYLPLHPQLVALIDDYRTRHVTAGNPLLLPRESGRALDRHSVTRMITALRLSRSRHSDKSQAEIARQRPIMRCP